MTRTTEQAVAAVAILRDHGVIAWALGNRVYAASVYGTGDGEFVTEVEPVDENVWHFLGYYAMQYMLDGATHGRKYHNLAEAQAHLDRIVEL
jgi:hypothetical protein